MLKNHYRILEIVLLLTIASLLCLNMSMSFTDIDQLQFEGLLVVIILRCGGIILASILALVIAERVYTRITSKNCFGFSTLALVTGAFYIYTFMYKEIYLNSFPYTTYLFSPFSYPIFLLGYWFYYMKHLNRIYRPYDIDARFLRILGLINIVVCTVAILLAKLNYIFVFMIIGAANIITYSFGFYKALGFAQIFNKKVLLSLLSIISQSIYFYGVLFLAKY